jgi:hypothetical protein
MGMAMTFVVLYLVWGLSIAKVIERGIERGTDNNTKATRSSSRCPRPD